jgi:hypothetical protein
MQAELKVAESHAGNYFSTATKTIDLRLYQQLVTAHNKQVGDAGGAWVTPPGCVRGVTGVTAGGHHNSVCSWLVSCAHVS